MHICTEIEDPEKIYASSLPYRHEIFSIGEATYLD
jgi:hypothetical protein